MLDLNKIQPKYFKQYVPWWKLPKNDCIVDVLIVADGGLNFGIGGGGLSEFLTVFRDLHLSPRKYKLTLAHRGGVTQYVSGFLNDPNILDPSKQLQVDTITSFTFDAQGLNLNKFDQIWLFGISSNGAISPDEVTKINQYMDNGGGLFATGDHGSLGSAMCGAINRVKDMRYWGSTGTPNQVSMRGSYRNDTNQAPAGQNVSSNFENQSDNIPQNIYPMLSANGQPHSLLSISKSIVPTGVISIMPDHPHEGECKPVTTFHGIQTQIVALSVVPGGNTAIDKDPTVPHLFLSLIHI